MWASVWMPSIGGLDGLVRYLGDWLEPFSSYHVEALDYIKGGPQRLVEFCQAMFNLNEFVYPD